MNSTTQKKPVFEKAGSDDFFKELQKEVNQKVLNNQTRTHNIIFKCIALIVLYFTFYSCILIFGNSKPLLFLFYVLSGFSMILVFLNGFHDAAHGAIFKTRKYNQWYCYILELYGSSNFIWKKRHLLLHHPFPNVQHWDIDIKQSVILRLFPSSKWLKVHRYQHFYMWLLYAFYTLHWIWLRDFKDIFTREDNYLKRVANVPKHELLKLIVVKVFNLFYMLIVPILVLSQPWYVVLIAFFTMHICASAFGVLALLSTHVNEDSVFPEAAADGHMALTWSMHQITVTQDFSTKSKLANFLFGGFNHHVAHHLFPTIAHTYYPAITPIIRKYAYRYHLPYRSYSLGQALRSHYYLLKKSGSKENLFQTGDL